MPTKPKYATTSAQSPAAAAAEYKRRPKYVEAHAFYNSARWRKLRAQILRRLPLCTDCEKLGRVTLATEVHHVEGRRENPSLAYAPENLTGCCKSCHNGRRALTT